jgi:branched-chain amino acid transport system substrate-binding protein
MAARISFGAALAGAAVLAAGCNSLTNLGDVTYAAGDSGPSGGQCSSTADCVASQGKYNFCRASDHTCQPLLSADCTKVVGDYTNDNAVFLGAMLPTTGANAPIGTSQMDAVELAALDFLNQSGGLPPVPGSKALRPIVLVECSDQSTNTNGEAAATHLIGHVGVPAIIGGALSGVTLDVLQKIAVPAGVLMISPATTSTAFTTLQKDGLFYRTVAPVTAQNVALARIYPSVESDLKARLAALAQPVKVAVVNKGDSFGTSSAADLQQNLVMNGKSPADNGSSYLQVSYGNPSDPTNDPPVYAQAAAKVLQLLPHVIFLFGTAELVSDFLPLIETQWPAATPYKPIYLSSWAIYYQGLSDYIRQNNEGDSLRKRLMVVTAGSNAEAYKTFTLLYAANVKDGSAYQSFGCSQAYDTFYVLAYAVASLGGQPITGASVGAAIPNVSKAGAASVLVGADKINQTLTILGQGQPISLAGASGPLDFDGNGDVHDEMQVTCCPLDPNGNPLALSYSPFYLDVGGAAHGTIADLKTFCSF